jgi:hypothetical protein
MTFLIAIKIFSDMMILIGTRSSNEKNGRLINETCPKCKTENSLNFSIYREYVHLTLVPLFPFGKKVFINCNHCNENFDYPDLNESSQQKLANEKLAFPILLYLGSFIIVLCLLFFINKYYDNQNEIKKLIQNPIEGDVYNLKFSNGYYSNLKIDKVTTDSIFTTHNDFNTYMFYEADDLDKPGNYSNRKINYSKKDIIKLFQQGEIIKINRKYK